MPRYHVSTHQNTAELQADQKTPMRALEALEVTRWENRSWIELTDPESGMPVAIAIDSIAIVERVDFDS